jgi:hypothetical protein
VTGYRVFQSFRRLPALGNGNGGEHFGPAYAASDNVLPVLLAKGVKPGRAYLDGNVKYLYTTIPVHTTVPTVAYTTVPTVS